MCVKASRCWLSVYTRSLIHLSRDKHRSEMKFVHLFCPCDWHFLTVQRLCQSWLDSLCLPRSSPTSPFGQSSQRVSCSVTLSMNVRTTLCLSVWLTVCLSMSGCLSLSNALSFFSRTYVDLCLFSRQCEFQREPEGERHREKGKQESSALLVRESCHFYEYVMPQDARLITQVAGITFLFMIYANYVHFS